MQHPLGAVLARDDHGAVRAEARLAVHELDAVPLEVRADGRAIVVTTSVTCARSRFITSSGDRLMPMPKTSRRDQPVRYIAVSRSAFTGTPDTAIADPPGSARRSTTATLCP